MNVELEFCKKYKMNDKYTLNTYITKQTVWTYILISTI